MAHEQGTECHAGKKPVRPIVSRVQRNEDRIVVHRHGNPVVALISLEDLEFLELAEDKFDAREARRRLKEKGVIPWEKIKKDLAL